MKQLIAIACAAFLVGCNELGEIPETPEFSVVSSSSQLTPSSSSALVSSSSSVPVSSSSFVSSSSGIEYRTLSDVRDGSVYRTVRIGEYEWTVDNMHFMSPSDSSAVCPENLPSCPTQGYLYDWHTATAGQTSVLAPSGVQGVCPPGWHIPSDKEFQMLRLFAGDSLFAGYNLKARQGWGSGAGADLYGFGAIPVGYRDLDSAFYGIGSNAFFWSATEQDSEEASIWYLGQNNNVFFSQTNFKELMASVRCIKNY